MIDLSINYLSYPDQESLLIKVTLWPKYEVFMTFFIKIKQEVIDHTFSDKKKNPRKEEVIRRILNLGDVY